MTVGSRSTKTALGTCFLAPICCVLPICCALSSCYTPSRAQAILFCKYTLPICRIHDQSTWDQGSRLERWIIIYNSWTINLRFFYPYLRCKIRLCSLSCRYIYHPHNVHGRYNLALHTLHIWYCILSPSIQACTDIHHWCNPPAHCITKGKHLKRWNVWEKH